MNALLPALHPDMVLLYLFFLIVLINTSDENSNNEQNRTKMPLGINTNSNRLDRNLI